MNGKPGDRPLPDGSGNYNPDGTLRDLDAENPSQADKMKLGYPEDMSDDKAEDDAGPGADQGGGSVPGGGGVHGGPGDAGHGHSGDSPGHTDEANPGHGGVPPGQVGGGSVGGSSPGHSGDSHGKSADAPGHNK